MKFTYGSFSILLLPVLASCMATTPQQGNQLAVESINVSTNADGVALNKPGASLNEPAPNSENPTVQTVRYIGTDTTKWPKNQSGLNISDLYTRFEVYSSQEAVGASANSGSLRDYDKEDRPWVARLVSSETDSVTTVANVEIRDPEFKLAIPLFSVSHASGLELGNTWTTDFTASYAESPLFRVGPNSSMILHLSSKISRDLKSQGASMVVSAVTKAVQIASPVSPLVTTLSSADVTNAASAIDTAISGLFSQDKTEDIELGRFADTWTSSAQVNLTGCAPFVKFDGPPNANNSCSQYGGDGAKIGTWSMDLRCPRLSLFDPQDICSSGNGITLVSGTTLTPDQQYTARTAIAKSANAGQILEFNLSSQVTILAFVQAQDWFTAFTKNTSPKASDYTTFCANALTSLYGNGLNKFDAALVLKTLISNVPAVVSAQSSFEGANGTQCQGLVKDENVTL